MIFSVLLLVISASLDRQSCAGSLRIGIVEEGVTAATNATAGTVDVLAKISTEASTGVGSGTRIREPVIWNRNHNCSIVLRATYPFYSPAFLALSAAQEGPH